MDQEHHHQAMEAIISNTGDKGEMIQPSHKQSTEPRIKVEANLIQIRAESTIQSFLVSIRAETTTKS